MDKVVLKIESAYESKNVTLDEELSFGRTDLADVILEDVGLSRLNTTIFREDDEVLVVDEGSSNGTFLNGEKLGREPKMLLDGDELLLGSDTRISVSIGGVAGEEKKTNAPVKKKKIVRNPTAPATVQKYKPDIKIDRPVDDKETPMILVVAAGSVFLIIFLALIGILVANYFGVDNGQASNRSKSKRISNNVIPVRIIDPLGAQKQEDLKELVQYFEVQDEVEAEDLADVTSEIKTGTKTENFNVSVVYWKAQRAIALGKRKTPTGNDPPGTKVPRELRGDGVIKQKAKIREMKREGYRLPMDFADLAVKRKANQLVELPMATPYWVLEVGGSSTKREFTSFNFDDHIKAPLTPPGSNDFNILSNLAGNFSGTQYSMLNPDHRRQMKIRLLRMFHPRAKPVLEEIAKAYFARFNRPLRVTSLSRSMQYQIGLNKFNPNSFKVRGRGSLPPHTSGCAFDLARKHMTAEEQNFMMEKLAEMERRGILDALREGNLNACFHVFVYDDGVPPKM
jgi:hypothetical protein